MKTGQAARLEMTNEAKERKENATPNSNPFSVQALSSSHAAHDHGENEERQAKSGERDMTKSNIFGNDFAPSFLYRSSRWESPQKFFYDWVLVSHRSIIGKRNIREIPAIC